MELPSMTLPDAVAMLRTEAIPAGSVRLRDGHWEVRTAPRHWYRPMDVVTAALTGMHRAGEIRVGYGGTVRLTRSTR